MKNSKSYEDLDVFILAKELAIKIHKITLECLPKFEMYEEGSQIRRSSKSVLINITEGFGRRNYKQEFVRFLTYAVASCDETKVHLELLYKTGSLKQEIFEELLQKYRELGAKLFRFRESVTKEHKT